MLGLFDDWKWVHFHYVHLIWVAIAVVVLFGWLEIRGRTELSRFISAVMQPRLAQRISTERRVARLGLIFAAFVFGILSLMKPETPGDEETIPAAKISADIMVVLDVSRSMLADDAAPNRLERAKSEIASLVGELRGHRIGLIAFAGRATVMSPLTLDYGFFKMVLRGVDTKSVSRGGTRIGDALRLALDAFGEGDGSRLILLITDGEDHDSYPKEIAKKANNDGVRIVSIGFGSKSGSQIHLVDPETGSRSLLRDSAKQPVISKLDSKLLQEISLASGGVYIPAGTAALDLESIVSAHIRPMVRSSQSDTVRIIPEQQYHWFALGAIICLIGAVWAGSSERRARA